jgi:hypothetical protein
VSSVSSSTGMVGRDSMIHGPERDNLVDISLHEPWGEI